MAPDPVRLRRAGFFLGIGRGCSASYPAMKTSLRSLAVAAASMSFAFAGGEGWMTDWEAAKAKAKAENKPILINITGSDWCGWCIKLEKTVFQKPEFKDFAAKNVILMEVDLPKKKELTPELKKQNEALKKQYLMGGFPTVLLLDAEGKKISGDLGELDGGPDAYVKTISGLIEKSKAK
jgi:protein disulfide-isomerase